MKKSSFDLSTHFQYIIENIASILDISKDELAVFLSSQNIIFSVKKDSMGTFFDVPTESGTLSFILTAEKCYELLIYPCSLPVIDTIIKMCDKYFDRTIENRWVTNNNEVEIDKVGINALCFFFRFRAVV